MLALYNAVLHSRPRFVLLFVTCFTFLMALNHPATSFAQDVGQVYQTTTSDGTAVQFNYPDSWIVTDESPYGVLYNTVITNDPNRIYRGFNEGLTGDQTQINLQIVSLKEVSESYGQKYDFEFFTDAFQVPWVMWNPQMPLEAPSEIDYKGKRAALQVYLQQSAQGMDDITIVSFVGELSADKLVFIIASTTPDHVEDTKQLVLAMADSAQYGDGQPEQPEPIPTIVVPRSVLNSGIPEDVVLAPITTANAGSLEKITQLPYDINPDKMILINDSQQYIIIQGQTKLEPEAILDAQTAHFIRYLTLEGDNSNSIRSIGAISADGTLVAAVGQVPADMGVYDAVTGALVSQPEDLTIASAAAFSPDGQTVAFIGLNDGSGSDRVLGLYDVATGVKQGSVIIDGQYDLSYTFMTFSPDGHTLFAPGGYMLNVETMSLKRLQTDMGKYQTKSATFNPVDETLMLTAGADDHFHVWNMPSGSEEASFTQGRGETPQFVTNDAAIYTPDGSLMITTAKTNDFSDAELAVWDARSLEKLATVVFPDTNDMISQLAISPDGTFILFVFGNKVHIYGVPS